MSKRIQSYTVRGRTLGIRAWAKGLGVSTGAFYSHSARFDLTVEQSIAHYMTHPKGTVKGRARRAAPLMELLTATDVERLVVAIKRYGIKGLINRADAYRNERGS